MLRVGQIGNYRAQHSTENELRKALAHVGHHVTTYQENDPQIFERVARDMWSFDFVLWTRTGWDPPVPHDEQHAMLAAAAEASVPVVGYHLDRWWGLDREGQIYEEPFFRVDLLVTADGGHDDEWKSAGIEHAWLPPAVSHFECAPGRWRRHYRSPIVFVGSWQRYHREWQHRFSLIEYLRTNYPQTVFWPQQRAVRGVALRDLYASVDVVIGDSCLVGGATRYWSDRIPETIGRGAYLIHPYVEGLENHFTDGEHLDLWPIGDWGALGAVIDRALADADRRRKIAHAGREHVLAHHTYARRMEQLVELMRERGLLT